MVSRGSHLWTRSLVEPPILSKMCVPIDVTNWFYVLYNVLKRNLVKSRGINSRIRSKIYDPMITTAAYHIAADQSRL
jgi:hypothetical protein